ncbi:MAG: hypothetical protein JW995_02835 [Melioribacteraceae bacterium]|nr:hypothetical protein [Melioribacteraceae bacterium]
MRTAKLIKVFLITIFAANAFAQDLPEAPLPPKWIEFGEQEESEYLKNIGSELKLYLKEIKEVDKERYFDLLRDYYFRSMNYPMLRNVEKKMRDTDKEILEYEILTEGLSAKYKKAKDSEKEKIRKDIEKNLTYLFDLKENMRAIEVQQLETRIDELKEKIKARKQNKPTIIKRRIEELLGDDKYLEWE